MTQNFQLAPCTLLSLSCRCLLLWPRLPQRPRWYRERKHWQLDEQNTGWHGAYSLSIIAEYVWDSSKNSVGMYKVGTGEPAGPMEEWGGPAVARGGARAAAARGGWGRD
ncbi:hypothetical protein C2E23DRAFT_587664 [Lenzites betulinus]|nr:hypothetical protein C2E23DRAFT_587664 [Lenzites betulinus]